MSGPKPHRKRAGHRNQPRREMSTGLVHPITWCRACDKHGYGNRKDARKALSQAHPGETSLRAYKCPQGVWHVGNVPAAVKAGERTIHGPIPQEDLDVRRNRPTSDRPAQPRRAG